MPKTLNLLVGILICCVLGVWKFCIGFLVMQFFLTQSINKSSWWEIPLASLSISVIVQFFPDYLTDILRVLIVVGSVLTAYFYPRRLMRIFTVAIIAIFLKNIYAVGAMWAVIWQCGYAFNGVKKTMPRKKSANAKLC